MYGLYNYGQLIADQGRTQAYAESLKKRVTPASVVVDIGTGTGILALLAGRLGARKVYAIEASDEVQFGRRVAAQNGLEGRVEFIQGTSTQVQLPEKADLIVSDIHGVLPAYRRSLFSIMDARDRFLGSGPADSKPRDVVGGARGSAHAPSEDRGRVGKGRVRDRYDCDPSDRSEYVAQEPNASARSGHQPGMLGRD
jgi:protein arginine N-methyltransferase 1